MRSSREDVHRWDITTGQIAISMPPRRLSCGTSRGDGTNARLSAGFIAAWRRSIDMGEKADDSRDLLLCNKYRHSCILNGQTVADSFAFDAQWIDGAHHDPPRSRALRTEDK
jgi:hypothetical protein